MQGVSCNCETFTGPDIHYRNDLCHVCGLANLDDESMSDNINRSHPGYKYKEI